MTSSAPTVRRPVPDALLPLPPRGAAEPVRRHRGCFWDHEQAAWTPYTPVPLPRPAAD
ncbi:hypothetical protein ACI784_14260 [Geodermatophilus sp. SYSU D01186]